MKPNGTAALRAILLTGILSAGVAAALSLTGLTGSVGAKPKPQDRAAAEPPAAIPTVSTAGIAREGAFFVGGHWVGAPGKENMDGAMYVEVIVPSRIRHPYPLLIIGGAQGQSSIAFRQTPDGRPGWAYDFVHQGYTVYLMDLPTRGRSAFLPGVDGQIALPRSGPLMEEIWTNGLPASRPQGDWPNKQKYTQWPSNAPNKGKMGDPVFDEFARMQLGQITGPNLERTGAEDIEQLMAQIGHPVILLVNSGVATSGWLAADAHPQQVKGIVAVEPVAPPIENAERGSTGPGRLWGVTNLPVHYEPPIKEASELRPVRQQKADGPGLLPCMVQSEPAHKLVNLEKIPVLDVSAEASYHRPYAHCVAKWLNQAGVKTDFVRLEDVGLTGNGHMMQVEKNSEAIAKFLGSWLDKNVR